ncbi:hypothetical protein BDW59DRAFT_139474 [Aspergillus cavernicola]|uniref:ENTH domain-containing protein n=1 Tax=Aspergillus cavernicola TaxID=176166 RepID=A0ABR4IXZ7_9EURO
MSRRIPYHPNRIIVRDATSEDVKGPSKRQLDEITRVSSISAVDFYEVMDTIDKRLYKVRENSQSALNALAVLRHCITHGSEYFLTWAAKNIYIVQGLSEFRQVNLDSTDVGGDVRAAASGLVAFIREEEKKRTSHAVSSSDPVELSGAEMRPELWGSARENELSGDSSRAEHPVSEARAELSGSLS